MIYKDGYRNKLVQNNSEYQITLLCWISYVATPRWGEVLKHRLVWVQICLQILTLESDDRCNVKEALDKYNVHLLVSYSVEDFKLSQYWPFQLIMTMRYHFIRYFVNSIIFRVSHRLLLYIYWSRLWKIENAIFLLSNSI